MQISNLTILHTNLTSIESRLTIIIQTIQQNFKNLTDANATSIQIAAGNASVTDAAAAATTFLVHLQAIQVNKLAMEEVNSSLNLLDSDGSLLMTNGQEVTSERFLMDLQNYFMAVNYDISYIWVAAWSARITQVSVTVNKTEFNMTEYKERIDHALILFEIATSFYKDQFKNISGVDATETQILTGTASVTANRAAADTVSNLKKIYITRHLVSKVMMLFNSTLTELISENTPVERAGSADMNSSQILQLVDQFTRNVSLDYLGEDIKEQVSEIESAKPATVLNSSDITGTEYALKGLMDLLVNLNGTIHVLHKQYTVITCNTLVISIIDAPLSTMTTRSSMMTTGKTTKMTAVSSTSTRSASTGSSMMMTTGRTTTQSVKTCQIVFEEVPVDGAGSNTGAIRRKMWLARVMQKSFQKYS